MLILFQNNGQYVQVSGLTNSVTSTSVTDATVTASLYALSDMVNPVFGPITLAYVVASAGVYRGAIPNPVSPKLGGGYVLKIDGSNSTLGPLHKEIVVEVHVNS
jgi:hypothetical protein